MSIRPRHDPNKPGTAPTNSSDSSHQIEPADGRQRLQKYLAHAGVASRRHAEELIIGGAVTINGQAVRELGTRINPATDEVRVRGELVQPPTRYVYAMLNKPPGTMSTVSDPQGRRTVLDLVPPEWRKQRIYPVGRLDWDTEGLLLLTNDGELALRLTHPRYALPKEYRVLVAGEPSTHDLRRLERGIPLADQSRRTAPARFWTLERQGDATWVGIEIHEGRNRQVRRMLEAIGYPVLRLRRIRIGPIGLDALKIGDSRLLTQSEVEALYRASGLSTSTAGNLMKHS
ncbi:MAG: pseudouridine synthase [Ktedonobacterales bacterium]